MSGKNRVFFYIFLLVVFFGGCQREDSGEEPILPKPPPIVEGDPDPVYESDNLTIGWIQRLPEMNYIWKSQNPTVEGWPSVGQTVTWRAFVKNWSSETKGGITFNWLLDGQVVDSGTLSIPGGQYVSTDFPWSWTFDRHTLDFVLEPEKAENNHLLIYTDSLSLGLYVEQTFYDYFHENQYKLGIGSNSFEGWAQRQMRMWNEILRTAIYPETPDGVLDRIRLDKITIVADGSLPLSDDYLGLGIFDPPQGVPNFHDRTVDLQWGFPNQYLGKYNNHTSLKSDNQFFYSGFLQHELGHARYLTDIYAFDVYHGGEANQIQIMENGELVAGSRFMPGKEVFVDAEQVLQVHESSEQGMMGADWTYMDRFSAICLNLIAGRRAVSGNYNAPENIGIFLNDLPAQNRLTIVDQNNEKLKNAHISIYQASPPPKPGKGYPRYFDNFPDLELITDENGQVLAGRCPFSQDGTITHNFGNYSNEVFIIRAEHNNRVGYAVVDLATFTLEYWRGNTQLADHVITFNMLE